MTDWSKIDEGGSAYRAWSDAACAGDMPVNPYPSGTEDHRLWEAGFDGAMDWQLYGQYEWIEDED